MRILTEADEGIPSLERVGAVGFVETMGERAALFGDPLAGGLECWMWPIEIFRGMRVEAHRDGERVDVTNLELSAKVLPDSLWLGWQGPGIQLAMHALALGHERAVVLHFFRFPPELRIDLVLRPIFRPMWPAGMGGQIARRDPSSGALVLSEELGRYAVVLGGPATNRADARRVLEIPDERGSDAGELRIPVPSSTVTPAPIPFFIAGAEVAPLELSEAALRGGEQSACGAARARSAIDAALALWRRLGSDQWDFRQDQTTHWRSFLGRTTRFSGSDDAHSRAFEWSKIAIERAWTSVDGVGRSVVAGVGPSRGTARPGFSWFFGGDALAATRALCAAGDFQGARELLRFVASTQRPDGKLMHELTLSARLCDWTGDYPYAYYKGQVSPGFVACLGHYWDCSGDDDLVRELWPATLRALRWCETTLDEDGRMLVPRAGIAAVEAGPLAGRIASEVFLEGIHISAIRAARRLARALALDEQGLDLERKDERARVAFETFWSEREGRYGFARLDDGTLCDDLTGYLGLPLSRGIGEGSRALSSAMQLSLPEVCADWGARMFSTRSSIYSAEHYNIGSVFPYLTNFVVLAQYEHALATSAEQMLESQVALCGFDGMGFVPEHLEGDVARSPRRGVPHQVFSSGAILQSIVYGLFGIVPDAPAGSLAIRSMLPGSWTSARLERFALGGSLLDLELTRDRRDGRTVLELRARLREGPPVMLRWLPRLPPLSRVRDGAHVARALPSGAIEAAIPEARLANSSVLSLELEAGPSLRLAGAPIERGATSRQVRMGSVRVEDSRVHWQLHGRAGSRASLPFTSDRPVRVTGASLANETLTVDFPGTDERASGMFVAANVVVELAAS